MRIEIFCDMIASNGKPAVDVTQVAAASIFKFQISRPAFPTLFFLPDPFWLQKISTELQIPVHVHIVCSNDRYSKFRIYISVVILNSHKHIPIAYVTIQCMI
jgi:hypothetical protein